MSIFQVQCAKSPVSAAQQKSIATGHSPDLLVKVEIYDVALRHVARERPKDVGHAIQAQHCERTASGHVRHGQTGPHQTVQVAPEVKAL